MFWLRLYSTYLLGREGTLDCWLYWFPKFVTILSYSSYTLIQLLQELSSQFLSLYRKGNFVYYHRLDTSIYRSLSYPLRPLRTCITCLIFSSNDFKNSQEANFNNILNLSTFSFSALSHKIPCWALITTPLPIFLL